MKHAIYPEKQSAASTTSADANYPVTNLTANGIRKKVWKAVDTVQTATLRVPIAADASVISLHKTNAETAICTITLDSGEKALLDGNPAVDLTPLVKIPVTGHGLSQNDVALINGTDNYDGVYTLPTQAAGDGNNLIITATYAAETFSNTDTVCEVVESTTHTLEAATKTYDRFWQEYTEQVAAHTATIKLTAATGETVEAGIVRAGTLVTLPNPGYGIKENKVDFSIKKQLRNGSLYAKKLEIVRAFSYSMTALRETEFRNLTKLYEYYGPNPFAMLISDNAGDDNMWCVFGSFDGGISGSHAYLSYSVASVKILEAV